MCARGVPGCAAHPQAARDDGGTAPRRSSPRADAGIRRAAARPPQRRCRPAGRAAGACVRSVSVTVVAGRTRCGRRWRCSMTPWRRPPRGCLCGASSCSASLGDRLCVGPASAAPSFRYSRAPYPRRVGHDHQGGQLGPPYPFGRLCHGSPARCPARALASRIPVGHRPWLRQLRNGSLPPCSLPSSLLCRCQTSSGRTSSATAVCLPDAVPPVAR